VPPALAPGFCRPCRGNTKATPYARHRQSSLKSLSHSISTSLSPSPSPPHLRPPIYTWALWPTPRTFFHQKGPWRCYSLAGPFRPHCLFRPHCYFWTSLPRPSSLEHALHVLLVSFPRVAFPFATDSALPPSPSLVPVWAKPDAGFRLDLEKLLDIGSDWHKEPKPGKDRGAREPRRRPAGVSVTAIQGGTTDDAGSD
jgi:hypothetical protein